MNLLYDEYPHTVHLCGQEREIVTDFKDWLRFVDMLRSDVLSPEEKTALMFMMYFDEIPYQQRGAAHTPLIRFFRMDDAEEGNQPEHEGDEEDAYESAMRQKPVYDFRLDARYIISGFWQDYRIDLTESEMHWWKFRILLDGLSHKTEFKQRVMYRSAKLEEIKDPKERQRIQRIQMRIAIPQPALEDEEIGGLFW